MLSLLPKSKGQHQGATYLLLSIFCSITEIGACGTKKFQTAFHNVKVHENKPLDTVSILSNNNENCSLKT
jgi:hypothetical protein